MPDDVAMLIPKTKTVIIENKQYKIGKLSLNQAIVLSRFIAKTVLSSQEKLAEFAKRTKEDTTNTEDFINIIDILNPEDVFELFGIILNENDRPFLVANLDLEVSSEIIAILCEYNDFEKIKKNIQGITTVFGKKKEKKES